MVSTRIDQWHNGQTKSSYFGSIPAASGGPQPGPAPKGVVM